MIASRFRLLSLLAFLALPRLAAAQVSPTGKWQTIETRHFFIHFRPETETLARRAARYAEDAYAELSRHLHPPRGMIDLVVSDDVDFSNGSATPFPTNRITIYANPTVATRSLRFTEDPTRLVVTHELVHIFQLDRVGGIWKPLQGVFGRVPFFFPNAYQPSWLTEGLAVYYESLLTESGRALGSEHHMIGRAASIAHQFPRIDQLSLAYGRFPYGSITYAYGSLFVDFLGRTYGDSAIRTFVESSSRQLVPLYLNAPSRRAFSNGITAEYKRWAASLRATAPADRPPMPGWRDLTVEGAYANYPRWIDDTTLVYSGTSGRESHGAYRITLQASNAGPTRVERIGRRHTEAPNVVLPDGSLLYSQLEFVSPYEMRSDLYVDTPSGSSRRLTHGARLSLPDARQDGRIVAMQTQAGSTRLVLVTGDGRQIKPITVGTLDEHWTEPRWSPDGNFIAAARWTRGAVFEIAVIDTTGRVVQSLIRERAVASTPSWSPDGRSVYFSSDRGGVTNVYEAAFRAPGDPGAAGVRRVSDVATGLFEPQRSPRGSRLSAVVFRVDGYHIGLAPLTDTDPSPVAPIAAVVPRPVGEVMSDTTRARDYSAWRSVLPRYWIPLFQTGTGAAASRIGFSTSGADVLGRHHYSMDFLAPTDNSGLTGSFYYRNASLGQPVIDLYVSQDWDNIGTLLDGNSNPVGKLRRRVRDVSLGFTFNRPRVRSASYLSLAGGLEARDYATNPATLLSGTDPVFHDTYYDPRVVASFGWSNTQFPPNAISAEDGLALASTSRMRWRRNGTAPRAASTIGSLGMFKSLDLPSFAHHVIAARVTGGAMDRHNGGYFEVGGTSGEFVDLLPGYVLGEGRRTFGVRGFPAGSLYGTRALATSVEYRAPLILAGRGMGSVPLFFDRASLTLFSDAGTAWCPTIADDGLLCTQDDFDFGRTVAPGLTPFLYMEPRFIGSAGAELNVVLALFNWDAPLVYRAGVAMPTYGMRYADEKKRLTAYLTVGVSF